MGKTFRGLPGVAALATVPPTAILPERGGKSMAGQIAAKEPKGVTLEAGKSYAWCACGLSANQPFCDGAHKATDMKPLVFKQDAGFHLGRLDMRQRVLG